MEFLKWTLWEGFRCTWPQLVELAAKEEIAEITCAERVMSSNV
jgi:hypothetical protein